MVELGSPRLYITCENLIILPWPPRRTISRAVGAERLLLLYKSPTFSGAFIRQVKEYNTILCTHYNQYKLDQNLSKLSIINFKFSTPSPVKDENVNVLIFFSNTFSKSNKLLER